MSARQNGANMRKPIYGPYSGPLLPINGVQPVQLHFGISGPYCIFEAPENALLEAGFLTSSMLPGPRVKCNKTTETPEAGYVAASRLGNGFVRLKISTKGVLRKDLGFNRFMRDLLSDAGLSLVKGERQ